MQDPANPALDEAETDPAALADRLFQLTQQCVRGGMPPGMAMQAMSAATGLALAWLAPADGLDGAILQVQQNVEFVARNSAPMMATLLARQSLTPAGEPG